MYRDTVGFVCRGSMESYKGKGRKVTEVRQERWRFFLGNEQNAKRERRSGVCAVALFIVIQ